jgi:AcrR family transcriptional regulator
VGRPKEHDAATGEALLDAAERIVEDDGIAALSVRRVADRAATTTRAVYAVFGSKEGLVVALGARAFEWLGRAIAEVPTTEDPAGDLVDSGVRVFRRFVVEHPALFRLAIQRTDVPTELSRQFRVEADRALARLQHRFERLHERGLLAGRTTTEAACLFHALCEGLAAIELRSVLPAGREEPLWRDALTALVAGFSVPVATSHRSRSTSSSRARRSRQ